ncbi:MAG TPA: FHA domain-containing protein [Anaerolineae bacterium]|nr:FHA domain-containing protein [Anaerolineae bacterium]
MNKKMQLYYNTIFGALGGLIAWLLLGLFPTAEWNLWVAVIFIGAGTGLFIGGAVGMVEGLILKRSFIRAVWGLFLGCLTGVPSGAIGLALGQAGFLLTQGGFIGRAVGWTALGFFLGAGQGFIRFKVKRIFYGLLGGTFAGLIGGVIYEGITQLFLQQSDTAQMFLGAVGLLLIGASLGGVTALSVEVIERVAGRGVLVVQNGPRQGMEVSVVDTVTLGSYDGCEVYLPRDPGIAKQHARVGKRATGFFIQDLPASSGVFVGNTRVSTEQRLRHGDQIRLGNTLVLFKEQ